MGAVDGEFAVWGAKVLSYGCATHARVSDTDDGHAVVDRCYYRRSNTFMEMDLEIKVRSCSGASIIDLVGEVDAYTSGRFREIMMGVIEEGARHLVVSMTDVQYIDSSGLGALVGGLKRIREKDGRISIVCDKPQVRKVFEITGLERVFPMYDNEKDAVEGTEEPGA
jgi:anti-sigma B factor antagonist